MSHLSPLGRRTFVMLGLSIVCGPRPGLATGQNPFSRLFGGGDDKDYLVFKDPSGRFEIEYPKKDWKVLLPTGGTSLAVFTHKDGAALFIDHVKFQEALNQGEADAMPGAEVDRLKQLQPNVKDFTSDVLESKAGRGVLIRYSRVGTVPESVMQFSILIGRQDLYRLNGIVPEKQMSKSGSIVMRMLQSFTAPPNPDSPKG